MKRKFIFIVLIFLSFNLFSLDLLTSSDSVFSYGVSTGFINGTIKEYVYDASRTKTNCHLSELDWDVVNIPYIHLSLDLNPTKYFFVGTNFKFAIPKRSGNMQDYDWLNGVDANGRAYNRYGWEKDDIGELTNYSIHDNYLQYWYDFFLKIGMRIYLPANIILSPFVTLEFEILQFDGYDGYSIYKRDNYIQSPFYGNVISYKLPTNELNFGLCVEVNTFKKINFVLSGECSPYLSNTDAEDIHCLRNTTFYDSIYSALRLKGDVSFFYKFSEAKKIGLSGSVKYQPESYDGTKKNKEGIILVSDGQGGNSVFLYDISLVYKTWL